MKNVLNINKPVYSIIRLILILGSLMFVPQCRWSQNASGAIDPADLLPIDNDISGYLRKGSTAIMTDEQSIYAAIDGEAQLYIDYGFMEGVNQLYSNGNIDIGVQLFNQGNSTNAKELFDHFQPTSPELLSQNDSTALIENALASQYEIIATNQSFLIRITTTEKTDFALNMAKQFYWNINNKIVVE